MRAAVSDVLILAGAAALGWFLWVTWPPGVWAWGGLAVMGYGWRLGVADASSGSSD